MTTVDAGTAVCKHKVANLYCIQRGVFDEGHLIAPGLFSVKDIMYMQLHEIWEF